MSVYNRYPSMWRRYSASTVDFLFLLAGFSAIAHILDSTDPSLVSVRVWSSAALVFCYVPLMTAHDATLGHRVMGIRVRRYDDPTGTISVFRAYLRLIVKIGLGWLSFITIGMNKERRGLHDYMGKSVVVQVR